MHQANQQETQLFISGYLECLAWSELFENYAFSASSLAKCEEDCKKFISENYSALCQYVESIVPNEYNAWERAGHDFALTRNGHGAGFWDRDYINEEGEKAGLALTEASEKAGCVYLYVNDENELEV